MVADSSLTKVFNSSVETLKKFSNLRAELSVESLALNSSICVALLPGSDFGRGPDELTARLSYVDFDGEAALNSLILLPDNTPLDSDFIKIDCGRVLDEIDRICDWRGK